MSGRTAGGGTAGGGPQALPVLQVVAGQAGPEELAAVTAVVAVLAARQRHAKAASRPAGPPHAATRRGGWPGRAALLRAPLMPGPGAWRRAVRPR
jgi:hypothetical protein